MNQFSSLLRSSRLASLSKPLRVDSSISNKKKIPVQQVLETTPASFHRRDWGLKAPIPSKHKSLYVNVSALDSMEGLAQYEAGSGFLRKLQRFREMGQPIQLWDQGKNKRHSYFEANSRGKKSLATMNLEARNELINKASKKRQEFSSFLSSKSDSVNVLRTKADKSKFAEEFCNLEPISFQQLDNLPHRTSIGLNYGLKGALHNTPQGVLTHKLVKGRQVMVQSKEAPAIGGFVCDSSLRKSNEKLSNTHNYYVQRVESDNTGAIKIKAVRHDNKPDSFTRYVR